MKNKFDVLFEPDILVVGGGAAGVLAAVSAARRGAEVLLVEAQGALGGSRTMMGIDTFYGYYSPGENTRRMIGGITYEVVERLLSLNAAFTRPNTFGAGTGITYDMEVLKVVYEQMVSESGAKLLYHTLIPEILVEHGHLSGVLTANKAGFKRILAKLVVDTTGDADIAAKSGASFELAGSDNLPVQSLSTIFYMGNVDIERAFGITQAERTRMMQEAAVSGKYQLTRIGGSIHPTPHPGLIHANLTRIPNIDATDPFALTEAEIEGRRQTQEYVRFLQNEHPGFEDAYLAFTACTIGVRETRRLIGEYVLSGEDVVSGKKFEDAVACCAAPIEDHHAGRDVRWQYVQGNGYYQIPYRSLLPKKVNRLIVAGRCLSATHEAQASARNSAQCMAMGEAAGVAAAIAQSNDILPSDVPHNELRAALLEQGVVLEPIPVDIGEL